MPFTFSHPALVLPFNFLRGQWISLTGLVIGSLTPDFEYFLRMSTKRVYGHTWDGLLWFDVPVGIALAFIFHMLVRNPLIHHLPVPLQKRLKRYKGFDWKAHFLKRWYIVILCTLIGSCSHLLLDSFTNKDGYFVSQLPLLQGDVTLDESSIPVYRFLYYLCSFVGGIAVIYAIWQLPVERRARTNRYLNQYWKGVLIIASVVFLLRILTADNLVMNEYAYLFLADYVIIATSSFLIGLIVTSVLYRYR